MNPAARDEYRQNVWPLPIRKRTQQRAPRRIGVELEFVGLTPQRAAKLVSDAFGGTQKVVSDYEIEIIGSRHGDYNVELDFSYLKARGRAKDGGKSESLEAFAEELAEGVIALVAKQVVPLEIVAPPIAMDRLWELEDLIRALRQAGARGTNHAPTYAFGLHLNPELPALDGDTVRRYLQSFLCLYPWLLRRGSVDLTRRITPYINPFPKEYLKKVLTPDYRPPMSGLIDDYLVHNPTRNRALDMLPLFKYVDAARISAKVTDSRINARPTLHYRLPNCQIDEPDWQLVVPWRDFLQVDALAGSPDTLAEACDACLARSRPFGDPFGSWAEDAYDWVLPELL